MANFKLNINGNAHQVNVDPSTPMLWVLRDHLGLVGTKYGCGEWVCGACTIHLDDEATPACKVPESEVGNKKITSKNLQLRKLIFSYRFSHSFKQLLQKYGCRIKPIDYKTGL